MPNPEFDIWGGDHEKTEAEIDNLCTDIVELWPAYEDEVIEVLDTSGLNTQERYYILLKIHTSIYEQIEAARELVEPWQPSKTKPTVFDQLAMYDRRPYDYEYEKPRTRKISLKVGNFAMNVGVCFGYPPVHLIKYRKDSI